MIQIIKVAIFSVVLLSAACSTFKDERSVFRGKSKDYLKTGALAAVELPAGMESRPLTSLYEIPEVYPRDEFGDPLVLEQYGVPLPTAINTDKGEGGVKLQQLGERKWIFLSASTSQVWPRTQNFLSQYGIVVAQSNSALGLIETQDVVFKDAPELKSRFRIAIEKGVHPETTEIHIVQIEFKEDESIPSNFQWPETSHNIERERLLLDELANVLVENVSNSAASLLGQNVGGSVKVEFVKNQTEPTMRIRLFEARARASLALALNKEGFVFWERSANKKVYYAGFDPDGANDEGFFSRLFGNNLPESAPVAIDTLMQDLAPDKEVKTLFSDFEGVAYGAPINKKPFEGLLLVAKFNNQALDVVVRDTRGKKLATDDAKAILRIIRKNLI